jgi:5-methylcytosine-specific restriction protein B
MENFTKESIEQAMQKIDQEPELIKGRESKDYDIIFENGKTYPPILVLSEASKVLGGKELVIHDFRNNTRVPFKILRDLGFKVVRKNKSELGLEEKEFSYEKFLIACDSSNFFISTNLVIRFIASLLTKPFVILTGLSGSGKTKLAIAFSKWMSSNYLQSPAYTFSLGEVVDSNHVSYKVTSTDKVAVTFTQQESGTKATFPYELINEWISSIRENNFTKETPAREIRNNVASTTKYSTQLNSFETHLKAAAFDLIEKDKKNYGQTSFNTACLIPVGSDWTNREPLLGYPNALNKGEYVYPDNGVLELMLNSAKNPHIPFFLILDEMNLSHVERYFSDFLSAMESHEKIPLHAEIAWKDDTPSKIALPNNLFIIGTVNIDETTYMFSPKVLDRANVIEFRVTGDEMETFLSNNKPLNLDSLINTGANMAKSFVTIANDKSLEAKNVQELSDTLIIFFDELKKTGAEFGFRTASEILRFTAIINHIEPNWKITQIIDAAIMQKLLPKIHGSRRKLEPILKTLAKLCLKDEKKLEDYLSAKKEINFEDDDIKYPLSLEKIVRMNQSLLNNGFTSYAEA